MIYDTLKLSKALRNSFTPDQAESLAEALSAGATDMLATKTDLADLKLDLIKWIIGSGLGTASLVLDMLKFTGH